MLLSFAFIVAGFCFLVFLIEQSHVFRKEVSLHFAESETKEQVIYSGYISQVPSPYILSEK